VQAMGPRAGKSLAPVNLGRVQSRQGQHAAHLALSMKLAAGSLEQTSRNFSDLVMFNARRCLKGSHLEHDGRLCHGKVQRPPPAENQGQGRRSPALGRRHRCQSLHSNLILAKPLAFVWRRCDHCDQQNAAKRRDFA
jgi:hypothetical protein